VDYVIFGIGMGASLVLFGFGSRTVGPSLRYRQSASSGEVLRADQLVAKIAWGRFCGSLGVTIAIGGVFLLAVTGIAMLLRLSDQTATICVVLAVLLVVVLMVVWAWAFVNRFGLYGIVTERELRTRRQVLANDDAEPAATVPVTQSPASDPSGPPPVVTATRRLPSQPPQSQAANPTVSPQVPDDVRPVRGSATQRVPESGSTDPSPSPQLVTPASGNQPPVKDEHPERETAAPGTSPAPLEPAPASPPQETETGSPAEPVLENKTEEALPDSSADDAAALERILNTPDAELRGPDNR
jgi:hypothetical protein